MSPEKKRQSQAATQETRSSKRVRSGKASAQEDTGPDLPSPARQTRQTRAVAEVKKVGNGKVIAKVEETEHITPKKGQKSKAKVTAEVAVVEEGKGVVETAGASQPVKKKRKTKEEKEAEAMPLAARSKGLRMFIGAHISAAGGVHSSVTNALHIGANSFALFLKSQRKWDNPPLQAEAKNQFVSLCKEHAYESKEHILPHGSYLVNLAQSQPDKSDQAYTSFLDDLKRCEALGIKLYNFHPGNTGSEPRSEAISRIADCLNRAHKETSTVVAVLENMAAGGNVIGSTFEDLRDIIAQVKDQTRVGVCLDTCHAFAAGYDLRTPTAFQSTLSHFDNVIGMRYLRALHLNDSKAPFDGRRDLHQNIGQGFLGLRAFHNVMNEPRFEGLPMVLETPCERKGEGGKMVEDRGIWAEEIKLLEGLVGMDMESEEFAELERRLQAKGGSERERVGEQVKKRADGAKKKAGKEGKKGKGKGGRQKKIVEDEEDSDGGSE